MATKITEDSLTCSICLRRFRKPRALPCLHSYCEECLIEYAPSGTQVMMCPLCQEKVSIPDGDVSKLKLDFRLQSQVEEANRYDNEAGILNKEIACNCCEDKASALAKCEQCEQLLCAFSVKAHKNMKTLRAHDVVFLTDTDGSTPVGQLEKHIDMQADGHTSDDDPIEKRSILVSNIPDIKHSPERVRDRITIHFQRKRHGGGDVDGVLYPVKGCPQNAVVVFNDKETCVSVLKCVQFLEDFQVNVTVEPLPQIFKEAEAEVNTFYWNLVPRLTTTKLIDVLSKRFGKTNLQVTKHILAKVKCPMSQLEEVHCAIVKAVGLGTSRSGYDAIDKGIIVKNIPYLTDEIQELRGELTKHLESEGVDQLQYLICPIQGKMNEAIAVFKTEKGCEEYMKRSDTSFYGDTLCVTKLPPVFKCIHARLEDFFVKLIKHLGLPTLVSKLRSCGDGIIVGDIDLTGSFEQLLKATDVIRDVTGLSEANLFSKPFGSDDTGDNIKATHNIPIHPGEGDLNKRRAEAVVKAKRKSGDGGVSSRRVGDRQPRVKSKADSIWGRRKEDRSSQKSHEVIDITTSGRNSSGAWSAIPQPSNVEDVSSEDFVSIDAIAYKCLNKISADKLRRIKAKFNIGIDIQTPDNKKPTEQIAVFKPLPNVYKSIQDLINAKEEFITLYQDSFFKIRRTPLTCDGLSQEVATYAIQETERKVEKIVIHKVKQHEYVFCGEEAVVTEAIAIFRQEAGNQPKPRRLMKKSLVALNTSKSDEVSHPDATDRHRGNKTLENAPSAYPSDKRATATQSTFAGICMTQNEHNVRTMKPQKVPQQATTKTTTYTTPDIPSASSNYGHVHYVDVVRGTGMAPSATKQSSMSMPSFSGTTCGICNTQQGKIHTLEGCKHKACFSCIEKIVTLNSACQECGALFGLVKEENCSGKMKYYQKNNLQLESLSNDGFITMDFSVPSGTQNTSHPNPGRKFRGMSITAYLPNTKEGLDVLLLIKWAFLNCQLFKISTSKYGGDDRLVLGDIPLKLKYEGGFDAGGYPDSKYLPQVRRILETKQVELTRAGAAAGRASAADGTIDFGTY